MNRKAIRFFIVVISIVVVVVVANITMRNLGIAQLNINIEYNGGDALLEEDDVSRMLKKKFGNLFDQKRKDIHSEEIEAFLLKQNLVSEANVFLSLTGKLNVNIVQNKVIVRVYGKGGEQFYLDDKMQVCKVSLRKAANVIIASGDLLGKPDAKKQLDTLRFPLYYNVYKIAKQINEDDILRNQIDQIYYSKKDDFQLIPKVGDYVILLGDIDRLEENAKKLHYLYKDGFTKHGWDNYSLVNLKFDNQVICTRK